MKPIILTHHAIDQIAERSLDPEWVERIARNPEWIQPDRKGDPSVELRYGPIPEFGMRPLRLAVRETQSHIWVIPFTSIAERDAVMSEKRTYDPEADAAYFRLADGKVHDSEEVADDVVLDFDAEGRVLGVEVLNASKTLAPGSWRDWPMPGTTGHSHAAE